MLSLAGLGVGLVLLIWLTMRGVELLVAAPLCALLVAATSGFAAFPQLAAEGAPSFTAAYMSAFVAFVQSWFFMFLLGSLFGKLMEVSGAADSVARWIVSRVGPSHAVGAVVLACAVLTYGGVSLFVVAFSVYPMALSLFREADVPRRFVPAALAFGWLGRRIGARRGIFLALLVYAGVVGFAYFIQTARDFYILAVAVGLVQGGIQSLSRSYFGRLVPEGKSSEFFGFYNMMGKASAIIGPTLVGVVAAVTGDSRLSILSIVVLFVAGGALLVVAARAERRAAV